MPIKIITRGIKIKSVLQQGNKIRKLHAAGKLTGSAYSQAMVEYNKKLAALGYDPKDPEGSLGKTFQELGQSLGVDRDSILDPLTKLLTGAYSKKTSVSSVLESAGTIIGAADPTGQSTGQLADMLEAGAAALDLQKDELDDLLESAELTPKEIEYVKQKGAV